MFNFFRTNNHYSSDDKNHYFSKTNPFYYSTREDWGFLTQLISSLNNGEKFEINDYDSFPADGIKNLGRLLIYIIIFVSYAKEKNMENAVFMAKKIVLNDSMKLLEEHDRRYTLLYIYGVLSNRFGGIPNNMTPMRVYKPDRKKVHPELKKILLLNYDNVKFQTE